MMRFNRWLIVCTCLALAWGCSRPPKASPAAVSIGTPPVARGDLAAGEAPKPGPVPAEPKATSAVDDGRGNIRPGQHKIKSSRVPPIPSDDWKPTRAVDPVGIAKGIDKLFRTTRNGEAKINLHMMLPIGEGLMKLNATIADPKTYRVSFPMIDPNPDRPVNCTVIANKGQMTILHPGHKPAYTPVRPLVAEGPSNGAAVAAAWGTDMPRLAFSHFIYGKDVFLPLVKALEAPRSGFRVTSEERTVLVNGRNFTNYRILARKVDPKTKRSLAEYEIVVDSHSFAPVTMRTHVTPPGKNATVVEWAGQWSDTVPDSSLFKLPEN